MYLWKTDNSEQGARDFLYQDNTITTTVLNLAYTIKERKGQSDAASFDHDLVDVPQMARIVFYNVVDYAGIVVGTSKCT